MTREGGPSPRREYATAWLSGAAPTGPVVWTVPRGQVKALGSSL